MRRVPALLQWPCLILLGSCAAVCEESPRIRELQDPATSMRALYEMTGRRKGQNFAEFEEEHANLRVTRCPQRGSAPPLYIVSHDPEWKASRFDMPGDYQIRRPDELFNVRRLAPGAGSGGRVRLVDQPLQGFHANGKSFTPFDGDNMITNGYLLDVNGDGIVEMLDTYNSGVASSHNTVEVLTVQTAELKPRHLLTVALNWHADTADTPENRWSWDIRPADAGNGKGWQVVLFPSTGSADKPGAVYQWDAAQQRFTGPEGGKGSHFARLPDGHEKSDPALETPRDQGGLGYAVKEAPSASLEEAALGRGPTVIAPPPARPYVKQSRAALTHAEMFTFMGPGRSWHDHFQALVSHDRVPQKLWSLPPRDAAFELVELNRSEQQRTNFQLAMEDRDGQRPPEEGALHLSHSSSACYNARHWEIFLSFHPGDSWLACARTAHNGAASYNALHDGTYYDFEWHELNDQDARHMAHTIWWLDRVRSRERDRGRSRRSMISSTADGFATLKLRAAMAAKPLLDLNGEVFASDITQRWQDGYNKEIALNFACLLLEKELPPRWGGSRDFLQTGLPVLRGQGDAPPEPTTTKARQEGTRMMLERFMQRLDQPPALPPAFLQRALIAAAETGLPLDDVVQRLETRQQPPSQNENELRELERRMKAAGPRPALEPILPSIDFGGTDPFGSDSKQKPESDAEKQARKLAEQRRDDDLRAFELRQQLEDDLSFMLRNTLPGVKRQTIARDDVAALKAWAASHETNAAWAMRRLQELDKTAYVDVLSTDLLKHTTADKAASAVALFKELCKADAAAARRVLAEMKGEPAKACAAIAPALVSTGERDVDRLLQLLSAEKTDYSDKLEAIDLLVPPDEPMRHREPRIEKALLQEMQEQAGELFGTGRKAAEALARREEAIQHWDAFKRFHAKERSLFLHHHDYLCRLVPASGDAQKLAELRAMLLPRLQRTSSALSPVFAALHVLNLRDTAPELERVATFDASDVEGEEAHSSSGEEKAVSGRFHMSRQILALWHEPDATTTARMLIAWSIHHASAEGMFADRVREQAAASLAAPGIDQAAVRDFLGWCLRSADAALASPMSDKTREMLQSWQAGLR